MTKLLSALVLCWTAVAFADEQRDMMTLRDGTVLTGHAVEIVPQQLIRMSLGDDDVREVAWADIVDVSGPSFQLVFGHPEAHPGMGRVPVDLTSVTPLRIGRRDAPWMPVRGVPHAAYRALCMTPCRLYLEPGFQPIEADGVGVDVHTVELSVPARGAEVALYAPTRGWSLARVMMPIPATALGLIGGILIGTAFSPSNDKMGVPLPRPDWTAVGGGIAALAVSVTLAILSGVASRRGRHGVATLRAY